MTDFIWKDNETTFDFLEGSELRIDPFIEMKIYKSADGKYNLHTGNHVFHDGAGNAIKFDTLDEAKNKAEEILNQFILNINFKRDIQPEDK